MVSTRDKHNAAKALGWTSDSDNSSPRQERLACAMKSKPSKWSNASAIVEEVEVPMAGSPWLSVIDQTQLIAREDRLLNNRLTKAELTYNEYRDAQERERAAESMADVELVRADCKTVERRVRLSQRGLLNPNGNWMQLFDLLTLGAMVFTVFVTPYEIGLLGESPPPLIWANVAVGIIFFLGMVFVFFTPYREPIREGGGKVRNHWKIAKNYLCGWFFIDLISTVPYDSIVGALTSRSASADPGTASVLKILRAIRLLKLGRVFRASAIVQRLDEKIEKHFTISNTTKTLIFWTGLVLVVIHWYCCFWGLLAQLEGTQRTAVLEHARVNSIDDCERGPGDCLSQCEVDMLAHLNGESPEYVQRQETWMCHAIAAGAIPSDVWTRHQEVYVFLLGADLSGPGFVSPTNSTEYAANFLLGIVMLILENLFVGIVAAAQSESDPHTKEFKSRMDRLNYFLREVSAPDHLCRRTREYLRYTRDLVRKQSFDEMFDKFSPRLRGDVLGHISLRTLQVVPCFHGCEPDFMRQLSQCLSHYGFEATDQIRFADPTLSIVTRGTAVRGGQPITLHQYWGADIIVSSAALRDHRPGSALTYVEIVCLTRPELLKCLEGWDESARVLRLAALQISMVRAPQLIARYLRQKADARASKIDLGPGKESSRSDLKPLVGELSSALGSLGANAPLAHREYHAVMKRINGGQPLRGFAKEQRRSLDKRIAAKAKSALTVAGNEGKLLIDEDGQVVDGDGSSVSLADQAVDDEATKAVAELRNEHKADVDKLQGQLDEIMRAIGSLNVPRHEPWHSPGKRGQAPQGRCGQLDVLCRPVPSGGVRAGARRRRQRVAQLSSNVNSPGVPTAARTPPATPPRGSTSVQSAANPAAANPTRDPDEPDNGSPSLEA